MASTEIDFSLTPFLLALLRAFRARLGTNDVLDGVDEVRFINLNTVEGIEKPNQDIVIYFDLYEMEPDYVNDPGTGQLAVNLMFQAWVLVKPSVSGASLKSREYALNLSAIVHRNRFSSPVGPAVVTDMINLPTLGDDRVLVWSVEWQHCTWIADMDQLCDDPPVDADDIEMVLLGYAPDVGIGHEDDYEVVVDDS